MAWSNFVLEKGFNANGALSRYRCVKLVSLETVDAVAAATDQIIGVGQFQVTSADITNGKGQSVMMLGVSQVEAASAIAVGARCTLHSDGRVDNETSTARIVGICVGSPSTNAGDLISMLVLVGMPVAP